MKNILFVVDEKRMGGVSILLEDMMRFIDLSNKNIDILVLHNNGDRLENLGSNINVIYGGKYFDAVDLTIKEVIKTKKISKILRKAMLVFDMKTGLIKYKILRERKKILNKKYDIEIAFKDGFTALFVAFGNTPKKIHWLHYDYKISNPNAKYDKLFKKILPKFDEIIAVSEGVMNDFNNIYRLQNKTRVIPNLIDINKIIEKSKSTIETKKNDLEIISVGRLHYMKGYDRFIDAIARLKNEGYLNHVSFKIYGDGPEKFGLLNKILDLNLSQIVTLEGKTDNPYKYMKNADLFVLSSVYEPFGLVIIEALTLGTPVIATENSATNKLIRNNVNGLIVENSTDGIYLGLKEILTNKEKLKLLKSNAKKFDYTTENEKIVKELEDLLR